MNVGFARYRVKSLSELANRILCGPVGLSLPRKHHRSIRQLIEEGVFFPAGNTLIADGKHVPLRPSCGILEDPTEEQLRVCWGSRIGLGMVVRERALETLLKYQGINESSSFASGVQRRLSGNMAVIPSDADVKGGIEAKGTLELANRISTFNISVSFEGVPSKELIKSMSVSAHATGDPGAIFLDNLRCKLPYYAPVKALVPCGEQGMSDGETCVLGAINLNSPALWHGAMFRLLSFKHAIFEAVRFLDATVDACETPDFLSGSKRYRRIGLGVTGFADALQRLKVEYNSQDAVEVAKVMSGVLGRTARKASYDLSHELGPFPAYDPAFVNSALLNADNTEGARRGGQMRNVSVTCLAPTGGLTLLAGNRGSSIEPFFSEATKIHPFQHLLVASAWSEGVCNAVSKTVNLKSSATPTDIERVFWGARELGLGCISVYRDQSRQQPKPM